MSEHPQPTSNQRLRRNRSRARSDRGAALVEFAIVVPLLVTILLGVVEMGFMLRSKQTVVQAARGAARAAANLGNDRLADYAAVDAVLSTTQSSNNAELESISVYKPNASGLMPTQCATQSVTGVCNFYSKQTLDQIRATTNDVDRQAMFSSSCGNTIDSYWCPTARDAKQKGGLDALGVHVVMRHQGLTGFFGDGKRVASDSVTRLEPSIEE